MQQKTTGGSRADDPLQLQYLQTSARNTALRALAEYDLKWTKLEPIGMSDSFTFRISTEAAGSYLLRIHDERFSRAEIMSELEWLRYLSQQPDIVMPQGIAASGGSYILETGSEEQRLARVTVMHWVEGEHSTGNMPVEQLYAMGAMLARMHRASRQFVPSAEFTRPAWGAGSFRLDWSKLTQHHAEMVTEDEWKLYQDAAARLLRELELMQPNTGNYGLIHGDLHSGNVVYDHGQPRAIDFGRCGYGYYLQDMAAAMLELAPAQRSGFIQGYRSVRELEADYEQQLECFFVMVMIGNYSHHITNAEEIPSLREEQPYAQAYLREYLNHTRFLFRSIKPAQVKAVPR